MEDVVLQQLNVLDDNTLDPKLQALIGYRGVSFVDIFWLKYTVDHALFYVYEIA